MRARHRRITFGFTCALQFEVQKDRLSLHGLPAVSSKGSKWMLTLFGHVSDADLP
jgi:hypothetical protein